MSFFEECFCKHCYHPDGTIMLDTGCKIDTKEKHYVKKCCKCGKRKIIFDS